MQSPSRLRRLALLAAQCAIALVAGCKSTTAPDSSGVFDATFVIQESGSYDSGTLIVSPSFAVSGVVADSGYVLNGLPASFLPGTLTVQAGGGAPQVVATNQAPSPRYAGTITATTDSTLSLALSGDTLSFGGVTAAIAGFTVDFSGTPVLPRISAPGAGDVLTPVSGLTVRWGDLPSYDQVEATLVSQVAPVVSVTARAEVDLGSLAFEKAQVASLPAGAVTLRVTRRRTRTLSVGGLRGGTATLAATVSMPLTMSEPVAPRERGGEEGGR